MNLFKTVSTGKDNYGVSYPFRIGNTGGIAMSGTDINTPTHIEEAIKQILGTEQGDRDMENFHSNLSHLIFKPDDISLKTLLINQIKESLSELEDRISVNSITDIESRETENGETYLYATINYTILAYGKSSSVEVQLYKNE